jgi:hypothetical protein
MHGAREKIQKCVMSWNDTTVHPHRFGGIEFRLGKRELGHLHGDVLLDVPFPIQVRNELLAAGMAEQHHVLPRSGWVSFHIRSDADVERGIMLLRRSFDLACAARKRRTHQTATIEQAES